MVCILSNNMCLRFQSYNVFAQNGSGIKISKQLHCLYCLMNYTIPFSLSTILHSLNSTVNYKLCLSSAKALQNNSIIQHYYSHLNKYTFGKTIILYTFALRKRNIFKLIKYSKIETSFRYNFLLTGKQKYTFLELSRTGIGHYPLWTIDTKILCHIIQSFKVYGTKNKYSL